MSFFLRHFAGFLIQVGAGMVLCLLPFAPETFRYARRWVFLGYSGLAVLFSALYFWIIRTELVKKLVVWVLMLFYAATQYLMVNLVAPLFPGGILPDVYPPLLLAIMLLGIFYWNLFRESVRRKRDNDKRKALEIQQLQYENITRDMDLTRLLRHDMRHHRLSRDPGIALAGTRCVCGTCDHDL